MGQCVRADIAPGRGVQEGPAHASSPAVPAGGYPGPAVRETGPVDVAARAAHRLGRDAGKADVERVAARHAGGGPAARDRRQIPRADREQPVPVGRRRGHQRVRAGTGAGAVALDAIKAPAAAGVSQACRQPRPRRLRGPDAPAARGRRRGGSELSGTELSGTELGEDGEGVNVTFGEPGQGEVFPGQVGQGSPSLAGPAATGQRQVQPT